MTEARGKVFVSYRRKRLAETNRLVRSLHDRGIPTWRDVDDLTSEPTEAAIRAAFADPNISGAILWLTPDVEDSHIIKAVEVPLAIRRRERGDGFWVRIVLADGLDYDALTELFADTLGGEDLAGWNVKKVASPRASSNDISNLATAALADRLTAIQASSITPLRVVTHAKGTPVHSSENALTLDWTRYFASGPPNATGWRAMHSAAKQVSNSLKKNTLPGTSVVMSGTPSLPAAFLLGTTFSTRDGFHPVWAQRDPSGTREDAWFMSNSPDPGLATVKGWKSALTYRNPSASALAVLVGINDSVSEQFARSRADLPDWRAIMRIENTRERDTKANPLTPEEAASLVHMTIGKLRETRKEVQGLESVHLFIAGPAGFAFMLGTMVATLPPLTAYEYATASQQYVSSISLPT